MTWLAADKTRSAVADSAAGLATNRGTAEEMAVLRPDLVLANAFSDPATVAMIRRLGIPVAVLTAPTSFAGIEADVRRVARLLGAPERGAALVADIEKQIGPAPPRAGTARPLVAEIEPGLYTEGKGTLIDEAIARAGGEGLGRKLGLTGYATLPLERLVAAHVDFVLTPAAESSAPSLSAAWLDHPALRAGLASAVSLAIPPLLVDCASPASARLVPMIRRAFGGRTVSPVDD